MKRALDHCRLIAKPGAEVGGASLSSEALAKEEGTKNHI